MTKSANKLIDFVTYTNDCFTSKSKPKVEKIFDSIEKKVAKKRKSTTTKKTSKNTLINIPKKATKPTPCQFGGVDWRSVIATYDQDILELYYQNRRLKEFTMEAANILHTRLQPNFSKFGTWNFLGSCTKELLNKLFSHQDCLTWDAPFTSKENGQVIKKTQTFFYFCGSMPDLLTGEFEWEFKQHPITEDFNFKQIESFYNELVIIIKPDNRVFCHYSQVTQSFCPILKKYLRVC
ncbi:predicted protein [Naegleria gruberi]|uniref:Predicted protein n=1 Tax=Naegleria gruberi TaxID=5762 RepID=D2VMF7_NAEGR|nr:uncharacterized protein NAEGRDRAFT_70117 [Naegleria gruberi]EFC41981.1 predicted protein [Naegleria gruberi]|eukprot:XP_002674725.1 predicted protein [Naegleria gruberi strain NEG-M]